MRRALPSIPNEIIEENILTRLPVKSISRFRCVCKHWCNDLFKNHNFIRNHLNHAIVMNEFNILVSEYHSYHHMNTKETGLFSIDHNVLSSIPSTDSEFIGDALEIDFPFRSDINNMTSIHGSCNGLVCIEPDYCDVCIWNPSTNEYKQVPATPVEYEEDYKRTYETAYGFGYDRKTDDYKFLKIVRFQYEDVSEARLYTVGTNSWRSLGFIPYSLSRLHNTGLLVDGFLHWVAKTETESRVVVSFDICNETFRETPLPDHNSTRIPFGTLELGMWEGKLFLVLRDDKDDDYVVWTMKDYTWREQMKITGEIEDVGYGRPIQNLQNGEILFYSNLSEEPSKNCLVSYDPKLESARVLKIRGLTNPCEIGTYIGTLVSLNSGTFVGQEQVRTHGME